MPFYTSLPSLAVDIVYNHVEGHLSGSLKLTKYQQMFVCLVKLPMNYLFRDTSYQLKVSVGTIQRVFHCTQNTLYLELDVLIQWSSRENLRKSMPLCFRHEFGDNVAVSMTALSCLQKSQVVQ